MDDTTVKLRDLPPERLVERIEHVREQSIADSLAIEGELTGTLRYAIYGGAPQFERERAEMNAVIDEVERRLMRRGNKEISSEG
jgi:hypothetical protein